MPDQEREQSNCSLCGAPQPDGCRHVQNYSPEFLSLVKREGVTSLLEGCHYRGSFEDWERERKIIAEAIDSALSDREANKPVRLLDIGSANGFLLRCLLEWKQGEYTLDPYGVDIDNDKLAKAKELFSEAADHFVDLSDEQDREHLPQHVDAVYWNVWDNADFDQPRIQETLERAQQLVAPSGKIILGFYHPNNTENERKLQQLVGKGWKIVQKRVAEANIVVQIEK